MKRRRVCHRKRGFTLVETMVVLLLFAIVGTVLVSSFMMGMRVWKRAAGANMAARHLELGFERMAADLRKTIDYAPIGFFGSKDEIYFANIEKDKIINRSYRYSVKDKSVYRQGISRQAFFGLEEETPPRKIVREIRNLSFSFYGWDNVSESYGFLDSWDYASNGIPPAVRVVAELEGGGSFEKIITIPVGQ